MCQNKKKTEWKSLDTCQRARCDSYSILFNLCGSPSFYYQNQNLIKWVRLFNLTIPAEKSAFFSHCFKQSWEKLSPWKMKKSPGILFSNFCMNPARAFWQATSFISRGQLLETHRMHFDVSLSKTCLSPLLSTSSPRKTRKCPDMTVNYWLGHKTSTQTNHLSLNS